MKSSTDGFSVIASYFGKGLFSPIPEGEPEFSIIKQQQELPIQKESEDDKMQFEPIPDIPAIVEESNNRSEIPEVSEDKSYLNQPVGGLDSWGQHYDDEDDNDNPFGEEPSATKPDLPRSTEKRIYIF